MNLGNNILKLRKENKLSQEELAEKVNVTRQTISNWELGSTQPTPEQLKLLSKIFNISVDELLDNDTSDYVIQKVSNTEKLAGIIIKILKVIGIGFLVLLVIDIVALILFVGVKGTPGVSHTSVMMECNIADNNYTIEVDDNGYFECTDCSKNIINDINKIIVPDDVDETVEAIEEYFNEKNGTCK